MPAIAPPTEDQDTPGSVSSPARPHPRVAHAQYGVLRVPEAELLASQFKALADPTRLRILSIVSSNPNAETCVCDLPGPLELSQSTISHHLKILLDAGIVTREKRGVWSYYSLVSGSLESLAQSLAIPE